MSQLNDFVRKRSINNVLTATVVSARANNPTLFDVALPDGKRVTLASALPMGFSTGDPVEVIRPRGVSRLDYIGGPAAVVLAGDPVNRVLDLEEG
jgi:hypothetical protein